MNGPRFYDLSDADYLDQRRFFIGSPFSCQGRGNSSRLLVCKEKRVTQISGPGSCVDIRSFVKNNQIKSLFCHKSKVNYHYNVARLFQCLFIALICAIWQLEPSALEVEASPYKRTRNY